MITELPEAPSRSDTPEDFVEKADAFLAALVTLVEEWNTDIDSANVMLASITAAATGIPTAVAAGTVNAITADYTPNVTVADQLLVAFVSAGENTSTTPTFTPDGGTTRNITLVGGGALVAGDIGPAGSIHILRYVSASTRYELVNPVVNRVHNEVKGSDIASAATVNLQAATGNLVHITGTTGITAITLNSGNVRDVVFDGILTLTHNATSLILPGGASITTAAGDRATFRGDGSGNVRCIHYTKASGRANVETAYAWTLLNTLSGNGVAAFLEDTTSLTSAYDLYVFKFINVRGTGGANQLTATLSTSGGYQATNYKGRVVSLMDATQNVATSTTLIPLSGTGQIDDPAVGAIYPGAGDWGFTGEAWLTHPASATYKKVLRGSAAYPTQHSISGEQINQVMFSGMWDGSTAAITKIKFTLSGAIASGSRILVYGVKTS